MNGKGRLETQVAALLRYGSWLASAAIGLGLVLTMIDSRFAMEPRQFAEHAHAAMGIALFIVLPMLRVC
jgi:hypothetical protein